LLHLALKLHDHLRTFVVAVHTLCIAQDIKIATDGELDIYEVEIDKTAP
jgi:hypothetical protein